jgi:hypothetical protein
MQIWVRYSEEYVNERFVRDGVEQKREETFDVPLSELSPEARGALLEIRKIRRGRLTFLGRGYARGPKFEAAKRPETPEDFESLIFRFADENREYLASVRESENEKLREIARHLEEIDSEETISAPLGRNRPDWGEHPSRFENADPDLREEVKALRDRVENRWIEQQQEKERAHREAKEAERRRLHQEKVAWCKEHGSDHLRESVEAGYNCQRMYVLERAAHEFPEYIADFEDEASWNNRACPSPEALAEAKRVDGKVVWLTSRAVAEKPQRLPEYEFDDYGEDDFEETEAVLIQDYLGKYDLIREM